MLPVVASMLRPSCSVRAFREPRPSFSFAMRVLKIHVTSSIAGSI
jgi:hypothetical protein